MFTHNDALRSSRRSPGQIKLYYARQSHFCWPFMAADSMATVWIIHMCARNCVNIRQHLSHLKLFLAIRPLHSVTIDIPGPLPSTGLNKRFIVFIADRFTNLTQTPALGAITARYVATAFCEIWVFKYGPPEALLADNRPQFASKLFLTSSSYLESLTLSRQHIIDKLAAKSNVIIGQFWLCFEITSTTIKTIGIRAPQP